MSIHRIRRLLEGCRSSIEPSTPALHKDAVVLYVVFGFLGAVGGVALAHLELRCSEAFLLH